jgi:N-acetylglucosamine-6-phosphate deacetylase
MHYVDLQVNGLAGVDFNSLDLSDALWIEACRALHRDGTRRFLPTLITDSIEALDQKMVRLGKLLELHPEADQSIAEGIHLEGPFLSPLSGYIGAHPQRHARQADLDLIQRWQDLSQGKIRMVTLAPEQDPSGQCVRWLADQGILVAAGHTNATLDELKQAINNGLTIFTHLGNACPMQVNRHDNIIQRAISLRAQLRFTMIADGHHIPYWLLQSWVDTIGSDRIAIISDAISAAGLPPGMHRLGDQTVAVGNDGVPRSEDGTHFVGSGMTLGMMHRQMKERHLFPAETLQSLLVHNATHWLSKTSQR